MGETYKEIISGLLHFYHEKFPEKAVPEIQDVQRISDGWESDVYAYNLEWLENGKPQKQPLILRKYFGSNSVEKAKDEFIAMSRLKILNYPVPAVYAQESDPSYVGNPFMIMERIDGVPFGSMGHDVPPQRKQELLTEFCTLFAKLHTLDWRPVVEEPPFSISTDPYGPIDDFLKLGDYLLNHYGQKDFLPVLDWLKKEKKSVPCKKLSVIHMDFHPWNILIDPKGNPYVIDWTGVKISDFRFDLAWTLLLMSSYGDIGVHDLIIKEYERVIGFPVENIEYFEVVAHVRRLLSIMVSIEQGAAEMGMRPGAEEVMKENSGHVKTIYENLFKMTGIPIPSVERFIAR